MSIQALSAEPLESAICCSSLAMRSLCASACVGAADCASKTRGEHSKNKANKQRRNFDILCSAPRTVMNRLERHSSEYRARKEIEKIYGSYKMFDLASS